MKMNHMTMMTYIQTNYRMNRIYSENDFKPGTTLRRVYYIDDDGDTVMTDEPIYEEDGD